VTDFTIQCSIHQFKGVAVADLEMQPFIHPRCKNQSRPALHARECRDILRRIYPNREPKDGADQHLFINAQLRSPTSSPHLDRPPLKNYTRRRPSGGFVPRQTPLVVSVNAVHLQGRKMTTRSAAPQRRHHQHGRDSRRGRLAQATHEVAAAAAATPSLRLQASHGGAEGRRAKPALRRKRVATMRSVDGWVREADPASKRRQAPLERHMATLRRKGNPKPRGKRHEPRPSLGSSGVGARGDSGFGGGGSTFLTELETDGTVAINRSPSLGQTADSIRNRTRSLGGFWGWRRGRKPGDDRVEQEQVPPRPKPAGE